MNDDKLIELADSYLREAMSLTDSTDMQHLLRLVCLRAALLENQLMAASFQFKVDSDEH